jgi:hypothetical protein
VRLLRWPIVALLACLGCGQGLPAVDAAAPADLSMGDFAPSHCTNRKKDGNETDVDCGGPDCPPCADSRSCSVNSDCASRRCTGVCYPTPSCDGGADAGCGGPTCARCPADERCWSDGDCQSGKCRNEFCYVPWSCDNGVKDHGETDVDCGGPSAPRCAIGKACLSGKDCWTALCNAGRCGTSTPKALSFAESFKWDFRATGSVYLSTSGDFDGDGRRDLAILLIGNHQRALAVLLGDGAGRFSTPSFPIFPGEIDPEQIVSADFNRDGFDDLAVGPFGAQAMVANPFVLVWYSLGNGHFGAPQMFATNVPWCLGIHAADMDGDDWPDLVAKCNGPPGGLVVLLNDRHGRFPNSQLYPLFPNPGDVLTATTVVDLDGDCRPDVVGNGARLGKLYYYLNGARGQLATPRTFDFPWVDANLFAWDVLGMGKPNVFISPLQDSFMYVFGISGGAPVLSWSSPLTYNNAGNGDAWLIPADFNGDGEVDIAAADRWNLLLNGGGGRTWTPHALALPQFSGPQAVAVDDFNGDGRPDLALRYRDVMNILPDNGLDLLHVWLNTSK